jgi:hypothetical protein
MVGRTSTAFWRLLELRIHSTLQPVSLCHPFSPSPFLLFGSEHADVSIPSTAARLSPSSSRSHSLTSATRARSFSIGSCHLYRHRPPGHHNLSGRANVSYKSGYLQPRGASRICPYFKELPLTSLSFHLPADLFQDILYLRYSRSLS